MSAKAPTKLPAKELLQVGYDKAVEQLRACVTPHGFLASPTRVANYRRVWARDGSIIGLAGLLTGETDLIDACRCTLETLAAHQGPHGEIPGNVDPETGRVSYGGSVGRVDGNLWFLICCGQYWRKTQDHEFLEKHIETIAKVQSLLGAWEFNNRGLLYIPLTGDWADEFLQHGYVLYDQLLYLQAQRELGAIYRHDNGSTDHQLEERIARLRHMIHDNYWFFPGAEVPADVYHEVLYVKGRKAEPHREGNYWMPFFSPAGYGYRFDAFANVLVSLLDVAEENQRKEVDDYITKMFEKGCCKDVWLIPAFHPVITPKDETWDELQMSFSYSFKNQPYEYQNGGMWPMIVGFYVADLARRGQDKRAKRYLEGIYRAAASNYEGEDWSFPEYINGKTFEPGGTPHLGWTAAGAIIAHHAVQGEQVFSEE
jgi:hypothetical protein